MAKVGVDIRIDASQALQVLDEAQKLLSTEKAEQMLRYTLVDVGRKTKTIVGRMVREDYHVKHGWVTDKVGHPQVEDNGNGLSVVIPIRGARGGIGMVYPLYRKNTKRKIRAKIVKSGVSELPKKMDHQGGNPPFIAKGKVFTRKTGKPYPIVRVVGLGVPQMPLNRSQKKIEKALMDEMERSVTRHFGRLFGG